MTLVLILDKGDRTIRAPAGSGRWQEKEPRVYDDSRERQKEEIRQLIESLFGPPEPELEEVAAKEVEQIVTGPTLKDLGRLYKEPDIKSLAILREEIALALERQKAEEAREIIYAKLIEEAKLRIELAIQKQQELEELIVLLSLMGEI